MFKTDGRRDERTDKIIRIIGATPPHPSAPPHLSGVGYNRFAGKKVLCKEDWKTLVMTMVAINITRVYAGKVQSAYIILK